MRCTSCGSEIPDGIKFCTSCGAKVEEPASIDNNFQNPGYQQVGSYQQSYDPNQQAQQYNGYNQTYPQPTQSYAPMNMNMNMNMEDTKPISPLGYIGYNILFSLPLIGIIMLFVFGISGSVNVNVKNYARSFLIIYLVLIVIMIIIAIIAAVAGASLESSLKNYYY